MKLRFWIYTFVVFAALAGEVWWVSRTQHLRIEELLVEKLDVAATDLNRSLDHAGRDAQRDAETLADSPTVKEALGAALSAGARPDEAQLKAAFGALPPGVAARRALGLATEKGLSLWRPDLAPAYIDDVTTLEPVKLALAGTPGSGVAVIEGVAYLLRARPVLAAVAAPLTAPDIELPGLTPAPAAPAVAPAEGAATPPAEGAAAPAPAPKKKKAAAPTPPPAPPPPPGPSAVVVAVALDDTFAREVAKDMNGQVTFIAGGQVTGSSLPTELRAAALAAAAKPDARFGDLRVKLPFIKDAAAGKLPRIASRALYRSRNVPLGASSALIAVSAVPEATDLAEFQFFSLAAALALLLFALLWEFSIELPERRALRQLEKDVARIGGDPSSRIETKKLPRQFQHFGNALNQLAQDFQSKLNQAMHLAAIPQPPPGDYSAMLGEEPTKPSPMAAEPPPPVTEPGGNKRAAPPAPPPGDEPSIPPAPQWEPPPTPSGPVALPGPGGPAPELPSDWASPPPPSDGGMAEPLDAPMPPPPPLDLDAPPPPDVPPGREPTVAQPYPQELIDATRSPDAIPEPPPPEPEMVDEIEAHHQEVYKNFLATRQQCGEPTEGLSYEKFKPKLLTLEAKHPGKKVRFTVYVKDGKAALKASVK